MSKASEKDFLSMSQKAFSSGHQISSDMKSIPYTLAYLITFAFMITLVQAIQSCMTKCGSDI